MNEDFLDKLSTAYYTGKPLVSDEEFDRLAELYNYNKVGTAGGDFPHFFRMYSLQKVHTGDSPPKLKNPITTPKLDGAAISVLYTPSQDGTLEFNLALTRGDGEYGKNISDKIKTLVPSYINGLTSIQFNCEVVAPNTIPNSRNYAAGALNLKSLDEFSTRDIFIVVHDILGLDIDSYSDKMRYAKSEGFEVVTTAGLEDRFPTDGTVTRELLESDFVAAGFTSKHPKGAYAVKPKPESQITKLLDVVWQVGRTGVISPVAILEPVTIGEARISRATLHNIEYIDMLDLHLGCSVEVIRSGEIIPRIVRKVDVV
mgnify:CR=1 FL=1